MMNSYIIFSDPLADTKNPLIGGIELYGEIFIRIEDFGKYRISYSKLRDDHMDSKIKRELEYYLK